MTLAPPVKRPKLAPRSAQEPLVRLAPASDINFSQKALLALPDEVLDLDVFLTFDYSQAEVRLLAEISGDPLLIAQFNSGPDVDIHSLVGTQLTGWSVERIKKEKNLRKMVKNTIFGTIYGIGRENLYDYIVGKIREIDGENADLTGITKDSVVKIYDRFFQKYAGVRRYIEEYRALAMEQGWVPTLFGFKREIREGDETRGTYWLNQAINCVDFETQILTKRGWLSGDELQPTDFCLTETGWQTPSQINRYPDYQGPVHVWNSRSFSAVSTPNHRWQTTIGVRTTEGIVKGKNWGTPICRTLPEIPVQESFSDDFIEVCGWALTDGFYPKGSKTKVGISQSKSTTKKRIQRLLDRAYPGTPYWEKEGCRYWSLAGWARGGLGEKIRKLFPERRLTEGFISSLSRRQANLLVEVMLLGDGSNECVATAKRILCCGTPEKAAAFEMLCAWAGHATRTRVVPPGKPAIIKKTGQVVTPRNPTYQVNILRRKNAQVWSTYETIEDGSGVWCPTFANDAAWVAKRSGVTYITKNSPIQGSAHQLVLMAMALLHLKPVTYNLLQRPSMEVHDAFRFFVRLRYLQEAFAQGAQLLQTDVVKYAENKFGRGIRVPMKAEASAGFCIGSEVDYKGGPLIEFLRDWQKKHLEVEAKGWKELLATSNYDVEE